MKHLFLTSLALTATAFAATPPEAKGKLHYPPVSTEVITPEAGPRVADGVDLFLTADFLYWAAKQTGLSFAQTGIGTDGGTLSTSSTPDRGLTYSINKYYKAGFRAGMGFNLGRDGWDLALNYTWYRNNSHASVDGTTSTVFGMWSINGQDDQTTPFTSASSNWKLHLNNFDLEMGRNAYLSSYFSFRPFTGLKGGWYDQWFRVTQSPLTSLEGESKMKQKQEFWWVGLRSGFDADWFISTRWAVFGKVALSGNWGRFNTTRKDKVELRDDASAAFQEITTIHTKRAFHTITPILEMTMGFRYDHWWNADEFHFGAHVGWEVQSWLAQNQFIQLLTPSSDTGTLYFQGLTAHFRFDF